MCQLIEVCKHMMKRKLVLELLPAVYLPSESIWVPKLPPEEKLSFQLSQSHLFPVCCNFILSSFSAGLHLLISLWICCTVLWSHLCCIFLLSDAETELNKSWYIFICWFSMCRLVWTDFFLVSFKKNWDTKSCSFKQSKSL